MVFEEIIENIHFCNWIPIDAIVKIRSFRFSREIFSDKKFFERNIFVFIENFCIRRVMKKCFSLCPGNVFRAEGALTFECQIQT